MPETKNCKSCGGSGVKLYLVSMHDDETDYSTCHVCNGSGKVHYMTDSEEEDYKQNNDW